MNILKIILCLLLFATSGVSQTRRPRPTPAPEKPPISIQTATTKDGRTVLLKSDGTWEYTNDPIVTAPPAAQTEPVSVPSASTALGSLSLESALVFRSGDVKPMARVAFYLMDENLATVLRKAGLKVSSRYGNRADTDQNLLFEFGSAEKFPSLPDMASFRNSALEAMKPHIKANITTDFSGKATFTDIPPGDYYLVAVGITPRGFVVWNVPVSIKAGVASSITLDQNNAAFAS
jgi:hypothetical protein